MEGVPIGTTESVWTGPRSETNPLGPPAGSPDPLTDTLAVQMKRAGDQGATTQQILEPGKRFEDVSERRKQQAKG